MNCQKSPNTLLGSINLRQQTYFAWSFQIIHSNVKCFQIRHSSIKYLQQSTNKISFLRNFNSLTLGIFLDSLRKKVIFMESKEFRSKNVSYYQKLSQSR